MITTEKKAEIIKEYQRKEGDTGSPEVQIADIDLQDKRSERAS